MIQAIKDFCSGPGDTEQGKIEQRPVVPFVQEDTHGSAGKDKGKHIQITCMYTPIKEDTKKKTYNVHVITSLQYSRGYAIVGHIKSQDIFF